MSTINPQKLAELPVNKQLPVLAGLIILLIPGYMSFSYSASTTVQAMLVSATFLIINLFACESYLYISKKVIDMYLRIMTSREYREDFEWQREKLERKEITYEEFEKGLRDYREILDKDWVAAYNGIYRNISENFQESTYYTGGFIFVIISIAGHYLQWWSHDIKGAASSAILSLVITLLLLSYYLMKRSGALDEMLVLYGTFLPFLGALLLVLHICDTTLR